MEKYEVVRDMMYGFDYRSVIEDIPAKRISGITQAMEFILGQDDLPAPHSEASRQAGGKKRYLLAVSALTKAFALAVPHEKAIKIRDEVGFFQEVRAALVKTTGDEQGRTPDEIDSAIKQLVSKAVSSTEVVDIFEAAGVDKPDISILSDEFLEEVRALPQKNLALELLKKLINDEIKTRSKKNVIQARSFAEMLEQTVKKYQNRAIEAAEIIQELIDLAKEIRKAGEKGNQLGLTEDELAFYDALADNGSAKEMLGDEKLVLIAQLLVERVKKSVSIDWTLRENARAQIRVMVKRILREYGYPPDLEKSA
jgi:type I restriction enzyme R subunit